MWFVKATFLLILDLRLDIHVILSIIIFVSFKSFLRLSYEKITYQPKDVFIHEYRNPASVGGHLLLQVA